jgi:hypothetical protein
MELVKRIILPGVVELSGAIKESGLVVLLRGLVIVAHL